jgi:hypothetical protein
MNPAYDLSACTKHDVPCRFGWGMGWLGVEEIVIVTLQRGTA